MPSDLARTLGEPPWLRRALCLAATAIVVLVLALPLAVIFAEALAQGWAPAARTLAAPEARSAIRLTLLVAAIVVPLNTAMGVLAAWAVSRYRYPGRRILDALLALPLSVSPVIAGLCCILLFGARGWFGPMMNAMGMPVAFALPGIVLCTLFVTVPLVAGQLVPVMEARPPDEEEAALTLGAGFWRTLWHVTLPRVRWGLAFGILLCNARAMGEFGAVAVVSGHIQGQTVTAPLHIEALYNEYDLIGAFALAALLAGLALLTVAARSVLEWRQARSERAGRDAVLVP